MPLVDESRVAAHELAGIVEFQLAQFLEGVELQRLRTVGIHVGGEYVARRLFMLFNPVGGFGSEGLHLHDLVVGIVVA